MGLRELGVVMSGGGIDEASMFWLRGVLIRAGQISW